MPMTTAEKCDKVQRLKTWHEEAKEKLESMTENERNFKVSQSWCLFCTGYRRLEHALNFLVPEERQISIKEPDQEKGSTGDPVFNTDKIKELFSLLDECTKNVTREYYERFQSLHSYIPIKKLDKLIEVASDQVEKCKERQSCTVNESDEFSPYNCAVALTAILGNCINIAEKRLYDEKVVMPDEEILCELQKKLEHTICQALTKLNDSGQSPEYFIDEAYRLRKNEVSLNWFAEILRNFKINECHGLPISSKHLSEAVNQWAKCVLDNQSNSRFMSLSYFVSRACNPSNGMRLQWNSRTSRFEND